MDIQSIKNRFGIIGNSPALSYALQVAAQVANTDLTVLIYGESGVGKEVFSQIIHTLSSRKHNPFIAVNCGAIPEGTIDSELFGHEKGSFTGAVDSRKGYFVGSRRIYPRGIIQSTENRCKDYSSYQQRFTRIHPQGEIQTGSLLSPKHRSNTCACIKRPPGRYYSIVQKICC